MNYRENKAKSTPIPRAETDRNAIEGNNRKNTTPAKSREVEEQRPENS